MLARLVTKVDEKILQYAYRVLNYLYTTKSFKLKFEKKIKQRGREQKAEKNNYKDTNDDFNCDKNINILTQIEKELNELQKEIFKKDKIYDKNEYDPQLQAYVDADYAGDVESRKSTTGFIICLKKTPIYWR